MVYLGLRMARYRIAALIAIACAVLGGAAFATGIGVLAESGLRSHAPVGRLAQADVVVSANQTYRPSGDLAISLPERAGVPADLAGRLARVPGVTAAFGDVSFPAAVISGPADAGPAAVDAGHGWASTALLPDAVITGAAPSGPLDVALDKDAGAAVGDRVTIVAAGHQATYRVSGVLAGGGDGVYFADATAGRLAGRVDLVVVQTDPDGADEVAGRIRTMLGGTGVVVSTGPARGDVAEPGAAAARALLPALAGSLAGVTLLMVGFIVAGALSVSIGAQRRDLALMRAVGATPRQIRRLAAAQAGIVAAAALIPGVALGYLLAERFRLLLVSGGMLPASLPLTFSPLPAVAAALLLGAVVVVAARCAAWRTSRLPATEAVAEARSEPRTPSPTRAFAGLLTLAGAMTVAVTPLLLHTVIGASATAMAGILAAIGLALLGPTLVSRASQALARRLPARAPAPTWLAVANSHGYALRVAGAVTTLAMAVVFTLTYTLTQTTLARATGDEVHAATRAQLSITAPALGGLPADLSGQVRAVPGVLSAAPVSTTTVVWPYQMLGDTEADAATATILTPGGPGVLNLDVRSGSLANLSGNTIAVAAGPAKSRDAEVGRSVGLILGDGAHVTAKVVAVYGRGLGFGDVVLSHDLAARHTTTGLDQRLLIRTDGSAAARTGLAAFAATHPGLLLDNETSDGPGLPPELWINIAVLGVLLGYLLLGIANKLVASTLQRRSELAVLQLIGATPRQVRAMTRRESALVCVAALGAGVLVSGPPLAFLGGGFLHRPWPAGPWWLLPAVAAVVAGIAFLAVELPTRRALRTPPVEAIGG